MSDFQIGISWRGVCDLLPYQRPALRPGLYGVEGEETITQRGG